MKKTIRGLLTLVIAVVAYCVVPKQHNITVVATNDLHGRFFDSAYVADKTNPSSLSKISQYVNNLRNDLGKNHVILLDIGDVLQGDNAVYYYNYKDTSGQAHLMSRIFNYMQYDAVVVGNHDIETGHPVYDKMRTELDMPYLAGNVRNEADEPYFLPYTLLKKGGLKIAVIGMTNPNIPNWLTPSLWSGMTFRPIQEKLQEQIDAIRSNEKVDLLFLAIHAGIGNSSNDLENPALQLAESFHGIDAIFAAHDHRRFCSKAGPDSIWVLEGGSRASHVAQLEIQYNSSLGKISDLTQKASLIKMDTCPSDPNYNERFAADYRKVQDFTLRPVGTMSQAMDFSESLTGQSFYLDFIHTVQLESTGAQLSIAAPLNTRIRLEAGTLNYNHLFQIYPFENQLYEVWMTGEEVKDFLEHSYDAWVAERGPSYNFDSVAGLIYEVDRKAATGKRIRIKSLANGDKFNPKAQYRVAINSYRASGTGDLESRVSQRLPEIRELIDQYVNEQGKIGPETLPTEKIGHWRFIF